MKRSAAWVVFFISAATLFAGCSSNQHSTPTSTPNTQTPSSVAATLTPQPDVSVVQRPEIFANPEGGLDPCKILSSKAVAPQPGEDGPVIGSMGRPKIISTHSTRLTIQTIPSGAGTTRTERCTMNIDLTTGPENLTLDFSYGPVRPMDSNQNLNPSEFAHTACGFTPSDTFSDHAFICRTSGKHQTDTTAERYITLTVPYGQFPANSLNEWLTDQMQKVLIAMQADGYLTSNA